MIQCPERNDAERNPAAGQDARHAANAPVSAADHHGVDLAVHCLLQRPLGAGAQIGTRHHFQLRRHSMFLEGGNECVAQRLAGGLLLGRAGNLVQQGNNSRPFQADILARQGFSGGSTWPCRCSRVINAQHAKAHAEPMHQPAITSVG